MRLPTSSGSLSRRPLASGGLTLVFFFAVLVVVTLFSFSETHKQTELTAAAEHSERRERERARSLGRQQRLSAAAAAASVRPRKWRPRLHHVRSFGSFECFAFAYLAFLSLFKQSLFGQWWRFENNGIEISDLILSKTFQ